MPVFPGRKAHRAGCLQRCLHYCHRRHHHHRRRAGREAVPVQGFGVISSFNKSFFLLDGQESGAVAPREKLSSFFRPPAIGDGIFSAKVAGWQRVLPVYIHYSGEGVCIAIHRKFQTRRAAEDSTRLYGASFPKKWDGVLKCMLTTSRATKPAVANIPPVRPLPRRVRQHPQRGEGWGGGSVRKFTANAISSPPETAYISGHHQKWRSHFLGCPVRQRNTV